MRGQDKRDAGCHEKPAILPFGPFRRYGAFEFAFADIISLSGFEKSSNENLSFITLKFSAGKRKFDPTIKARPPSTSFFLLISYGVFAFMKLRSSEFRTPPSLRRK